MAKYDKYDAKSLLIDKTKGKIHAVLNTLPVEERRAMMKSLLAADGIVENTPEYEAYLVKQGLAKEGYGEKVPLDPQQAAIDELGPDSIRGLRRDLDAEVYGQRARKHELLQTQLKELERDFKHTIRRWGIDPQLKNPTDIEVLMMLYTDMRSASEAPAKYILQELNEESLTQFDAWGAEWRANSYARLACGHKLAAALMMTTAPEDIELQAPWNAWSLYVPNGMLEVEFSTKELQGLLKNAERQVAQGLGDMPMDFNINEPKPGERSIKIEVSRIWCRGTEPIAVVQRHLSGGRATVFKLSDNTNTKDAAPVNVCVRNYVRGVCLMLDKESLPEKRRTWGPKSGKKRTGKEPATGVEYEMGSPITVDLRDAVHEFVTGKRKGHSTSPSVQFLVRGHWRHQAYGPLRADRKWIWIQAFWKGDVEARVLLRSHVVRDKPEGGPPEKEKP